MEEKKNAKKAAPKAKEPEKKVRVREDCALLNLRAEPSKETGAIVAVVRAGQELACAPAEAPEGWIAVKHDRKVAYCMAEFTE